VVKARLQQREIPTASKLVDSALVRGAHYDGVIDCVKRTWRHEGVYGFYKGCLPNALRVAPGAAITFYSYETISDMLRAV
jgi:solute carrier family 25 (mitochondrial folate transporter), member 32